MKPATAKVNPLGLAYKILGRCLLLLSSANIAVHVCSVHLGVVQETGETLHYLKLQFGKIFHTSFSVLKLFRNDIG